MHTSPEASVPPLAVALAEKIRNRTARIGVVGLGYVGLPLAVEFAEVGFHVTGIDLNAEKVQRVNAGDSYVGDVPSALMAPLAASGKLKATTDFSVLRDLDTVNICVPTPLRKTKDPDMSYIVATSGPGQSQVPNEEHSQGRRWNHSGLHGTGSTLLLPGAGTRGAGHFDPGGRDGEAAGEYLPDD
jgi:hypothetical protein